MALTPPPTPPNILDPVTFAARMSAWVAWLCYTFIPELTAAVGSVGWGSVSPTIGNASVTDSSLPPGSYNYNTIENASSGGPPGATRGALYISRETSQGRETQRFIVFTGTGYAAANSEWVRTRGSGGAWADWRSDSLHSEGESPTGRWWRWCNGRQECELTGRATSGADWVTWNYPSPSSFLGTPAVHVTVHTPSGQTDSREPRHTARDGISVQVGLIKATGGFVAGNVDLTAKGKWAP